MKGFLARLFPKQTGSDECDSPLPSRTFERYIWFWHIVTIALYLSFLGVTLWNERASLGWQEGLLVLLVGFQLGAYVRFYIFSPRWPLPWWHHAIYFGGGLIAWFIQSRLFPSFNFVLWMFYGQAFGLLPPVAVIPFITLFQFIFLGQATDWNFATLEPGTAFAVGLGWISTIAAYWFIYNAIKTSGERGKLIQELEAAKKELEAARAHEAELAALKERERIARDMHDNLGHTLVALSVQLEATQRLYRVDPSRASVQIDQMKSLVRESMAALRRTLDGLRAPSLGDRPLRQAIQEMSVAMSQRSGVAVSCHIAPEADTLNPALAEALWGVAQEALTNIEKHARARHAEICIDVTPNVVTLRVSDDGVGLSPNALSLEGRYGLRGMRERIEGVGGSLTVQHDGVASAKHTSGAIIEAQAPLISG